MENIFTIVIVAIVSLVVGVLASIVATGKKRQQIAAELQVKSSQLDIVRQQLDDEQKRSDQKLQQAQNVWNETTNEKLSNMQASYEGQLRAKTELMEQNNEQHAKDLDNQARLFDETLKKVEAQLKQTTDDMLKQRQREFSESSNKSLNDIVNPLKDKIKEMQEAMQNTQNSNTDIKSTLSTQMSQFIQQSIDAKRSTDELTRVLKHETKLQGNWGEVILSNLLDAQGLRNGVDYILPDAMRDTDGNLYYPDVVIHLDNERDVIIDSKVSISAFMDYANATDDIAQAKALKEHLASIKKHVTELSKKNYPQLISDKTVDFVIMFIPHSEALMLALKHEPQIWNDAMNQKVFIATDQTLCAALHIIRLTWTKIEQEKNQQKIYDYAANIVNRVNQFLAYYDAIGKALNNANIAFEDGRKKLLDKGQSIPVAAKKIIDLGANNHKNDTLNKYLQWDDDEEDSSNLIE